MTSAPRLLTISILLLAGVTSSRAAEVVPMGPEFRVSRIGDTYHNSRDGRARDPRIVSTSDGGFVVAWESYSSDYGNYYNDGYGVFFRRFDATGKPKDAQERPVFFKQGSDDHFRPNLAIDSTDRFVVVWGDYNAEIPQGEIFGRRFNAAGNPQGATQKLNQVSSAWVLGQADISVASTAGNGFVAVWEGFDTLDPDAAVFARRFDGNEAPLGGEFRVNGTNTGCCYAYPAVASDAAGRFMVVWQSEAQEAVMAQPYAADGTAVGSEIPTLTGALDEGTLRITANASGTFLPVGYVDNFATARLVDAAGNPLGPQFVLPNVFGYPNVDYGGAAPDPDGNFIVAWQDFNLGAVLGQRYSAGGSPDGAPFTVALPTDDFQIYNPGLSTVAVAADDKGDFTVSWANDYSIYPEGEPEGPYEAPGIWARRFAVCGNGRIGRTQTCDDGNAAAGDGCSSRCGLETCFSCTGEPSSCVAVPGCTTTCVDGVAIQDTAVLTFQGMTSPVPGRQAMTFKGAVPAPPFGAGGYSPLATGLGIAVTSGANLVYQVAIPPGAPGSSPCGTRDGWKAKGNPPTAFTYTNQSGALPPSCAPGSAGGLKNVKISDRIATGRGLQFSLKVSRTTFPSAPVPPVLATLVFGPSPAAGDAGRCARIPLTRSIGFRFYP